ncbi:MULTISPECIES: glutamate-1-semialdehyde 2,1-aminomutase [Clostridium]|uniref:Glutamate-1-semialdehyde 2,1-aminomutase n=1 Tax=Clostridium cadaveris TaxID=1529 RepID=A0A1I2LCZ2_9CLOT|nr:glutamate-1-semialdehyde 2,1-aminomutase [Clostridium cadaveris]MDU4953862.1 glutamate-1-semialdehyde 2,1-aminomutase [Clostridium sp.]MDY4008136.1 glutamate-1-semialdehyde 2,1-aminomutase [Candidatus Limiplasma sp.]MDM8313221.1 glutamate-1-semialdehyde 2,1-aminomutase [Clostridium cadaveris]NME66218.1 glutamate-1-semialdehyde 2,1-aminomutase [Clostridium cadaveris]PWL54326.1 MAG: glutamate-1-semialdehyde-2,1-aminomutase [Clostridium cadaveris]
MINKTSSDLFKRAKEVMPGGVNSPVRAFRAVGSDPLFIKKANGSKIYDADGHEYIDYICSWGPMILGHNHPIILDAVAKAIQNGLSYGAPTENEVLIGELIRKMVPNVEMIRMVNSGTEAVMSAIRVARGFTGRNKIIKFEGCYHGHSDSMLVKAGSGLLTEGTPDSLGVPKNATQDTLTAEYNNIESVRKFFENNKDEIAAVIVEPVAANMGVVPPKKEFLEGLRAICTENKTILIFDEVITGFRLARGGAQEYFGIEADLVTYGKIIGGGMPVGAYGGRREIMEYVSPLGGVYQAGTLSGNPVAMAAGLAQLTMLYENPEIYEKINKTTEKLAEGFRTIAAKYNAPISVNVAGSLMCPFFTDKKVENYNDAKTSDTEAYAKYFNSIEERGIYIAPSQFEAMFMSYAHSDEDIDKTLQAAEESIKKIWGGK